MKKYKRGYTSGVYDMFHVGHLNVIMNAKQYCEYLIVAVSTDEVVLKNKNGVNNLEFLDTSFINRFITQNPYDISYIKNWEQLHNKGQNITVGIFGSIYDKDISQKISELKEFKKGFNDDNFSEDYVTENDMYCYALSSSRKANTLVRTR